MAKLAGQDTGDQESTFFIIGVAVIIMAVLAWMLFGERFSSVMGIIRRIELIPFAMFFSGAAVLRQKLVAVNGDPLDFSNTVAMLQSTGEYVRWIYIPIIAALAFNLLGKSSRGNFKKVHTMTSLAEQEAKLWPEIAPIAGKQDELVRADHSKGPWASAQTEWEFSLLHQIADQKTQELNRDKARAVFISQLGPRWSGVNALPKHAKALYAALTLFIAGDRKEGERVMRLMAQSFADGDKAGGVADGLAALDTSFVEAALQKHGAHPLVRRVLTQHAYTFTVMATMLQIARSAGVLATSMFIWLKPVDRRLWYTLNNTGRYAFHVECAGIMAHWLWEKTVGEGCPTPVVEKALDGLAMALKEYCEDDSEDRMFK